MTDSKPKQESDGLEVTYKIPVERFQYEDELVKENQRLKKQNSRTTGWIIVVTILALLIGWGFSAFVPTPFSNTVRQEVAYVTTEKTENKIISIRTILEKYWYFAKDIENLTGRLTDQALIGMTTNEEDPHTTYMTSEEIMQFTQSINRNFVGIGVQFQSQANGLNLITRVFRDSPAEKAGVQAGDIIHSIDGTVVDNMSADEIKKLVQGEIGTDVTIVFLREGKYVTLDITRGEIGHTVNGKVTDEGYGLIQLEQFGETTANEVQSYLDEFREQGATKLIIDLRDNGGGYLEALEGVVSAFLPANTVFIRRDYANGVQTSNKTVGGNYTEFSPIVILTNNNTASASEAFTMAMKEQRDDVVVVGMTTYGKGSVQVTQYYDDGSALKYTDSIWKSPDGVWINNIGIEPNEIVELHPVLNTFYETMEEDLVLEADSVSSFTEEAQLCLDFLGYEPGRTDGYFSEQTKQALLSFQKETELEADGKLSSVTYEALVSAVIRKWSTDLSSDLQYQKALEILSREEEAADRTEASAAVSPSRSIAGVMGKTLLYEPIDKTLCCSREFADGTI